MLYLEIVRPTEKYWVTAAVYAAKNHQRHQRDCCSRLHCFGLAIVTYNFFPVKKLPLSAMRPFVKIVWPLVITYLLTYSYLLCREHEWCAVENEWSRLIQNSATATFWVRASWRRSLMIWRWPEKRSLVPSRVCFLSRPKRKWFSEQTTLRLDLLVASLLSKYCKTH